MTVSERELPPGPVYLDTSALAKLYLPEPDSDSLNRALEGRRDLVVSDLAVTEVVSSLCRRRCEGVVSVQDAGRLHREIRRHLEVGLYRSAPILPATHRDAERLLLALEAVPLRAADALHLALALGSDAVSVATYDRRLGDATVAVGLALFPK